ncbi:acyltransferase family protein [Bradyrhizobium sp. 2TAF24]|uniref:acyltransferase family protein n=1 Tax=Bradyrhizobium sp. 2TAF24 TaxID=3233011 RepID=UPI003F8F0593
MRHATHAPRTLHAPRHDFRLRHGADRAPAANIAAAPAGASPLRALQIGRGLAAVGVVLFHLNNSLWGVDKYFPHAFSPLLGFGNAGVQFFFVLSGFIIAHIHAADVGMPERVRRFAAKRLVRVYPTYWVVLAALLAALFAAPALGTVGERDLGHIVASVLLLPVQREPVLSVAWTLQHEVLFYLVFAVCILNARIGVTLFIGWQLACLVHTLAGGGDSALRVVLSANNLLFMFGIAAAYLHRTWRCPAPGLVAVAGALVFLGTGAHQVLAAQPWPADAAILAFGLSSAIAILGACSFERAHGLRAPRVLDAIGDASYSIYLVHLPLLSVYAKALFATGLAMLLPQPVTLVVMLAALIGSGLLFSRIVEMPLIALLSARRRLQHSAA